MSVATGRAGAWLAALALAATAAHAQRSQPSVPAACRSSTASDARNTLTRGPNRTLVVAEFTAGQGDSLSVYTARVLTDELSRRFTRARGLAVISPRRISSADRAAFAEATSVLDGFDAHWTVSGTVTRRGSAMQTSVTLLHDGVAAWTRSGTRSAVSLPVLEDEVVRQTLASLGIPAEGARSAAFSLRDTVAYDNVLRGEFLLGQPGRANTTAALTAFETATRIDSTFAAAWLGVARGYWTLLDRALLDARFSRDTVLRRAVRAADRALALDPRSAEAWALGGKLLLTVNPPTLAPAREALARAIRLDPRDADAQDAYGRVLLYNGDWDGAEATFLRSLEIAPLRAQALVNLAELRTAQRRYGDACTLLNDATAVDPWNADAYVSRSLIRLRLKDLRPAWSDAEIASRLGDRVRGEALSALIDVASLDFRKAAERLKAIPSLTGALVAGGRTDELVALAAAHVAVRDTATAFRLLGRLRPGSARLAFELQRPEFAPLRGKPQYARLLSARPGATPSVTLRATDRKL